MIVTGLPDADAGEIAFVEIGDHPDGGEVRHGEQRGRRDRCSARVRVALVMTPLIGAFTSKVVTTSAGRRVRCVRSSGMPRSTSRERAVSDRAIHLRASRPRASRAPAGSPRRSRRARCVREPGC